MPAEHQAGEKQCWREWYTWNFHFASHSVFQYFSDTVEEPWITFDPLDVSSFLRFFQVFSDSIWLDDWNFEAEAMEAELREVLTPTPELLERAARSQAEVLWRYANKKLLLALQTLKLGGHSFVLCGRGNALKVARAARVAKVAEGSVAKVVRVGRVATVGRVFRVA